ncbi:MAG: transcription antitermination factor NusB [Acidimicrobiales bacterium]
MSDDTVGIGSRREGRETVLGLLYEAELTDVSPAAVLDDQMVPVDGFVATMVQAVSDHQGELDDLLDRYSKGWSVDRMPVIDRLVLRMGVYELVHTPDVPTAVALSEAVDLVGQYSTEKSSAFVNGLLARIADEVRTDG